MNAAKMLTGKSERAWRLNELLPESEYRYLYALLCEHEPVSQVGKDLIDRLGGSMGKKIDAINKAATQ